MITLTHSTPITSIVFLESGFWPGDEESTGCIEAIQSAIASAFSHTGARIRPVTVRSEQEADELFHDMKQGLGVFTAMSGAVQLWMLKAAGHFSAVALCAGFVGGFITLSKGRMLLERNAAPATMDVFSTLQRNGSFVWFIRNSREIVPLWEAVQAVERFRASTDSPADEDGAERIDEGDIDAMATMRLVNGLATDAQWLCVPAVGGGSIRRAAKRDAAAAAEIRAARRTHDEREIGVSPDMAEPLNDRVTLCRIGRNGTAMDLFVGTAGGLSADPDGRARLRITLDSADTYTKHSLGDHQMVCRGDLREQLTYAAALLGLDVLR